MAQEVKGVVRMNDEVKARLVEACKSMSTQEVADAIAASRHGGAVSDPLALAAYLKSLS